MKTKRAILWFGLTALALPGTGQTIRTVNELLKARLDPTHVGQPFELTGTVQAYFPDFLGAWVYTIDDGTSTCFVSEPSLPGKSSPKPRTFELLDRIRVSGRLSVVEEKLRAVFDKSELIGKGNPITIPDLQTDDLITTQHLGRIVRLRGRIRHALRDDTDPNYIHMTLHDARGLANVMIIEPPQFPSEFIPLIGAEVAVTGVCVGKDNGLHRHFGPFLNVSGLENVRICTKPDDFSTAPDLATLTDAHPRQMAAAGFHQTTGVVLASWNGNAFLLQTVDGLLVRVRLLTDAPPRYGETVRALGLPATDSFHLNLIHARWERTDGRPAPPPKTVDALAANLTTNEHGFPQLMVQYYGKAVRLTGIVRYLPDATHANAPIQLESGGQIVSVNASALPQLNAQLEIGCRMSVTGTCVIDRDDTSFESRRPADANLFLVPRTADDIVVLSRPSWWTPGRLLALLGIFAAALLGIIGWNVSLNRRAKAKGRELAEEQLAHVTSELKVSERTRLAIELHDMLSQMLSGISMQIGTVRKLFDAHRDKALDHLSIAEKTLLACRENLRDCLWDLRNHAIEEPDMNKAIRDTLEPHVNDVSLAVRFSVPRDLLSDNAAHAILSIIRELVVNAIRHGAAKSVKVAGSVEDGKVLFSVTDDGSGFDPSNVPGMVQGHFGLQGIRERVEGFEGEMSLTSAIGKGTKVTIALHLPQDNSGATDE